jgi:hypothetical protein
MHAFGYMCQKTRFCKVPSKDTAEGRGQLGSSQLVWERIGGSKRERGIISKQALWSRGNGVTGHHNDCCHSRMPTDAPASSLLRAAAAAAAAASMLGARAAAASV